MQELLEGYSHWIYGLPVVWRGAAFRTIRGLACDFAGRFACGRGASAVDPPRAVRVDFFRGVCGAGEWRGVRGH